LPKVKNNYIIIPTVLKKKAITSQTVKMEVQ